MDCDDVTRQWAEASQRPVATKGKFVLLVVVSYVLLAWCCWTELCYRNSLELPAQFTVVGNVIHTSRQGNREMHRLRYTFQDPVTGQRHQNTVEILPSLVPAGQRVTIQYLPGEYSRSRLAVQARPEMVTVFYSITALLALIGVGALAWLSREAHIQPPRGVRSFTPTRRRFEIT